MATTTYPQTTTYVSRRYHLRLRYVLKRELLWDPCLDIVGQRVPNIFVDRDAPLLST